MLPAMIWVHCQPNFLAVTCGDHVWMPLGIGFLAAMWFIFSALNVVKRVCISYKEYALIQRVLHLPFYSKFEFQWTQSMLSAKNWAARLQSSNLAVSALAWGMFDVDGSDDYHGLNHPGVWSVQHPDHEQVWCRMWHDITSQWHSYFLCQQRNIHQHQLLFTLRPSSMSTLTWWIPFLPHTNSPVISAYRDHWSSLICSSVNRTTLWQEVIPMSLTTAKLGIGHSLRIGSPSLEFWVILREVIHSMSHVICNKKTSGENRFFITKQAWKSVIIQFSNIWIYKNTRIDFFAW